VSEEHTIDDHDDAGLDVGTDAGRDPGVIEIAQEKPKRRPPDWYQTLPRTGQTAVGCGTLIFLCVICYGCATIAGLTDSHSTATSDVAVTPAATVAPSADTAAAAATARSGAGADERTAATSGPAATAAQAPTSGADTTLASEPTAALTEAPTSQPSDTPDLAATHTEEVRKAQAEASAAARALTADARSHAAATERSSVPVGVREYLLWAGTVIGGLHNPIGIVSEQSSLAGADPTVILDDDWILRTATALAMFRVTADEIRSREDVPVEASDLHSKMLELAGALDTVATNYAAGVDNFDANRLEQAIGGMQRIGQLATEMTAEVDRLQNLYGRE